MKLLLDSHALIWMLEGDTTLSDEATSAIKNPENEVLVSAASAWELAIKAAAGRLRDHATGLSATLESNGIEILRISFDHALRAGFLPPHHKDPFDRMLVAQAQVEDLTIVTRDPAVRKYDVKILLA